jgi:hypothetical protein
VCERLCGWGFGCAAREGLVLLAVVGRGGCGLRRYSIRAEGGARGTVGDVCVCVWEGGY